MLLSLLEASEEDPGSIPLRRCWAGPQPCLTNLNPGMFFCGNGLASTKDTIVIIVVLG